MKKQILLLALLISSFAMVEAQIGQFETAQDIGDPKGVGSSTFDASTQTYTLEGAGYNIWFNHDEFHFLYKPIKGDFLLTANFQLIGNEDGNGHRKTGWMIRETTDHDAVSVNSCIHGDGLAVLQWRPLRGAYMRDPQDEIFFPKQYFGETIIQLERIGKTITMRLAHPGEPLEEMSTLTLPDLNDEVLIGPYVLAHDPDDFQQAKVWNVRISTPVPPSWHPNPLVKTLSHDGLVLANRLETLDIVSGQRKVIFESNKRLSTPTFGKNGKELFFKSEEALYKTSPSGGAPVKVTQSNSAAPSTDNKYYNDNSTGTQQIWQKTGNGGVKQLTFDLDHKWFPQVSPDGKWLVYMAYPHDSNPNEAASYRRVTLQLMPTSGGAPKTIAYLYGGNGSLEKGCWSPDGKSIAFISNSVKE